VISQCILFALHGVSQVQGMEYFISFFFMEVASKTHKSHANDRGTLRYKSGITFWNLENCDIRQVLGPRRAGYHRFYCTLWQIPGV